MINRKTIICSILIFVFSIGLRLWNLNMMGRWGDEQAYLEKGYALIELAKKQDFSNPYWYVQAADHPPMASYFYGLASSLDFITYDHNAYNAYSHSKGAPVYTYDITYTRLVSVIVSSLAILLVFLIGSRYLSLFIGLTASFILAMLPHFLGFSQLLTLESWIVFLFTLCVFLYLLYLETGKKLFLIATGIATGLCLEIKESNILIFVFYVLSFCVFNFYNKRKQLSPAHFINLIVVTLISCFITWPMSWFHPVEYFHNLYLVWFSNLGSIPELIFGKLMGAGLFYYPLAFVVTTPVLILLISFGGIKIAFNNRKQWIHSILLIWFSTPFLMSFFHHRQHMVSYVIQFYAPLLILAAIGFENIITKITKNKTFQYTLLIIPISYFLVILINIKPVLFKLLQRARRRYKKRL